MSKVFLETYGCQMNEYDSELVRAILLKENYEKRKNEETKKRRDQVPSRGQVIKYDR